MNRLWVQLTAAFMLVVLVGVLIVAGLSSRATASGFATYVDQERQAEVAELGGVLADYYDRRGSWDGVAAMLPAARGQGGGGTVYRVLDASGIEVASSAVGRGRQMSGVAPDAVYPILVGGALVGTLTVLEPGGGAGAAAGAGAEAFLASVNRALLLGAAGALLLALILGVLLAQRLTRPLRQLTMATRAMARGDLEHRVPAAGQDEIGELAESFNQMAAALAGAESQRRQLLADIAHELRTPLSVMRGHVEAMIDGVFPASPENLTQVHEETVLLGRLIEDLRTLSLVEAGQLPLHRKRLELSTLLESALGAFEPLAEAEGVAMRLERGDAAPAVMADPARLHQVLGNLLANALRHAPEGSSDAPAVSLALWGNTDAAHVVVADNGPGLTADERAHVFDRFWRSDPSRSRANGGSGLGLAIARGIVEAHGGRLWVESTRGAGAAFHVELPAAPPVSNA